MRQGKEGNKICFFNTAKVWGGGEKWHLEISKYLHEQGHEVLVICSMNSDLHKKLQKTNVKHIALDIGKFSYLNPYKIKALSRLFVEERVGTVVINLSSDVKIAAHAAKKAGVKRVIYRRGSSIPLKNSFYNRFIFKHWITEVLANSEATKQTILQNNKNLFPEDKIKVIYNGIDIEHYTFSQKIPGEKLILGNVGRLEFQKGHEYLISVAEILRKKGVNFELRIVGKGSLHNFLQNKIEEKGLTGFVKLLGFRDDVNNFMREIDIFLLSSRWEGFGYVTVEAMATGKPVVAFDISSTKEIVVDGETGFLIKPFDLPGFADAIIRMNSDKEMYMQMAKKSRERVERLFSNDVVNKQIEEYLTR